MVEFIAARVEENANISLEKGQAKYRAYFVNKKAKRLYAKYRDDVDAILVTDGYEDCIVED